MLELYFEGWFQCRLARDPDPSDEKRGVSGASFATVYEPDLDRIIRLNDPVASRRMYMLDGHQVPEAGVLVNSVYIDGQKNDTHPLLGARVDFLDGPKFQCLNGVFVAPGYEPIDPFHISISRENLRLSRKDVWDPKHPEKTIYDLPLDSGFFERRQPVSQEVRSLDVRNATGIFDPTAYVKKRILDLQAALHAKQDARGTAEDDNLTELDLQIAGLQQRLSALTIPPELTLLFESQVSVEAARALDARQSQPETPLSQLPEANQLVEAFKDQKIEFSDDALFVVEPNLSPEVVSDDPAFGVCWKIKDPFHWVNPSLGKQPPLQSGAMDSLLYLPAVFRVEKVLQRAYQYAIIAFEETEVWQSKVFKLLLDCRLSYQFDIRGPAQIEGDLGLAIVDDLPWPVTFWMGAWDNDALSGYIKGCLQVPLRHRASASRS